MTAPGDIDVVMVSALPFFHGPAGAVLGDDGKYHLAYRIARSEESSARDMARYFDEPAAPKPKQCDRCRFREILDGTCRGAAPMFRTSNPHARWPLVAWNDWCGKFEEKA